MEKSIRSNEPSKPVILITGASGLIGSRLINKLADRYQCIGLDKQGNLHANKFSDEVGNSIPIGNQIKRIYNKNITSHLFPGNILHGNAFIHLDDLDDAFIRTIVRRDELPAEAIINIGETFTYSYEELQNIIGETLYGREWITVEIPKLIGKLGAWAQGLFGESFIKPWMIDLADHHYELVISKAKQLLDWQPTHSLRSTLPKIIATLKEDPEAWFKANKLD